MTVSTEPLSEINHEAMRVLVRELGIVRALRFMGQYRTGAGDYTADRHQWLDDLPPLDVLVEQAQQIDRERAAGAASAPGAASDV